MIQSPELVVQATESGRNSQARHPVDWTTNPGDWISQIHVHPVDWIGGPVDWIGQKLQTFKTVKSSLLDLTITTYY